MPMQSCGSRMHPSWVFMTMRKCASLSTDTSIAVFPESAELAELVCKIQKHRHSATCRRHGSCRFHYPRPPSPFTVIARECQSDNIPK